MSVATPAHMKGINLQRSVHEEILDILPEGDYRFVTPPFRRRVALDKKQILKEIVGDHQVKIHEIM